jgi:hypothetical protein
MAEAVRHFTQGELTVEAHPGADELRLVWRGRSSEREPGTFLLPLLAQALETCRRDGQRLTLDFSPLEYMNSSTFTPIVRTIDEARRAGVGIALEYSQAKKWQALSFSALRTFETPDGRIAVLGR